MASRADDDINTWRNPLADRSIPPILEVVYCMDQIHEDFRCLNCRHVHDDPFATAYERFTEGRQLWNQLQVVVRNMGRIIWLQVFRLCCQEN